MFSDLEEKQKKITCIFLKNINFIVFEIHVLSFRGNNKKPIYILQKIRNYSNFFNILETFYTYKN